MAALPAPPSSPSLSSPSPSPSASSPPPSPLPPPLRRVTLERLSRPLLARFLTLHASDFCAAHAFPLSTLAASPPHDRTLLHALFPLLVAPPSDPSALSAATLDWLSVLDALATPTGTDRLLTVDTARLLPRAKLGDEDFALTAILDYPDLARRAHALLPSEAAEGIDGFTEYDPAESVPFRFGDPERKQLESLCAPEFDARGRTRHCLVHVTREPRRLVLEIEYGRRPQTRDKLDVDTLSVAPATDVNTERAFAEIDRTTDRLALHAPHPAIKEILRKALGKVIAGNEDQFRAARVYDLSPFRNLETALAPHGDRLLDVELHRLTVRTAAESEIDLSRARRDIRRDEALRDILARVTAIGTPVAVKLYLKILDRRLPLKVELSAKQGRNRLHFNRSDPQLVTIVRGYLIARGVLREIGPAPALASTG